MNYYNWPLYLAAAYCKDNSTTRCSHMCCHTLLGPCLFSRSPTLHPCHYHRDRRHHAHCGNDPGNNFYRLDFVAQAEPPGHLALELLEASGYAVVLALHILPDLVDENAGDDPEDSGDHQEDLAKHISDEHGRCDGWIVGLEAVCLPYASC
jgi:hypothetical protein